MANFNFNRVMLGGRLTADPENRQTETGVSMTRFSIAVNRRYSKDSSQQQVKSCASHQKLQCYRMARNC